MMSRAKMKKRATTRSTSTIIMKQKTTFSLTQLRRNWRSCFPVTILSTITDKELSTNFFQSKFIRPGHTVVYSTVTVLCTCVHVQAKGKYCNCNFSHLSLASSHSPCTLR
eukprot:TRINITY_DN21153_c0_g1_i1.p1 TRINITY_DN21153_c0_g1~~TRINITY_DN21153_c0_g1_i1.p1  ORF type:complete len:110 (+),score=1.28 TRINITY_DN21153_c0_g1_i1:164-493(+)